MRLLISIFFIFICCTLVYASSIEKAKLYINEIKNCYNLYWKEIPLKQIPMGQIEQESNWNSKAHLHTYREDGYGLVQITVTPRFNSFLTAKQYKPLKSWNWKKDPYNTKNQITFLVLQDRDNYNQIKRYFINDEERFKGLLVCYNAGLGRVLRRRQFAIAARYKHDTWTHGLEDVHDNFENKNIYGRPLWKAVNEYPRVIFKKSEKYKTLF